jgi:hypothetical protein
MQHTLSPFPYEERLASDLEWALMEGSMHFEQKSAVQQTLRKITARLDSLGIGYAIAGGMALFSHGFRRFTEYVDILVTRDGLKVIHEHLEGRGYVPPFRGSKNLRDTEYGVRIEFLVAGEFPGDGRPKPVAFPQPEEVSIERDGICYLQLAILIELKLASGMSNPNRMKDLADVQELIKLLQLSADFAGSLNLYVRQQYLDLWQAVTQSTLRYVRIWQSQPTDAAITSLDDLIELNPEGADILQAMRQEGVVLDLDRSRSKRGYFVLITQNPTVAARHDLHDESKILYEE